MSSRLYAIATELFNARQNVEPVLPLSNRYNELSVDDAYAIQSLIGKMRQERGERIVGYKVGLTSEAVQKQLGVSEPDFGLLFSNMEIRKDQALDLKYLIAPKAEGEIGFTFKCDLENEDLTFTELKSAIDYFFPTVEIVDSAIADWKITLVDTIADNASSASYVVGDTLHSPNDVDFSKLELSIYGEGIALQGVGSACLGNPLYSTYWLVKKMISLGRPIRKGQVVLSGALAPMVTLVNQQNITFSFKGLEDIVIRTI